MKRSAVLCSLFIFLYTASAAAFDTQPYFEAMFVDGNQWSYQDQDGNVFTMEVLPGTESFNGCSAAKRIRQWLIDENGSLTGEYLLHYYTQDDNGFYEVGRKEMIGTGAAGDAVNYTITYTPHKKIAALQMDTGCSVTTDGTYTYTSGSFTFTRNYSYTTTVIGFDQITVPYGTLEALKFQAQQNSDGNIGTDLLWVSAGISTVSQDTLDGERIDLVTFQNIAINADAGDDRSLFSTVVQLDGSHSSSENEITSYSWQIEKRTYPQNFLTASGASPLVTGLVPGVYDVTLTIEDETGLTAQDQMMLFVFETVSGDTDEDGDVDGLDLLSGEAVQDLSDSFGRTGPENAYAGTWYHYQCPYMGFARTRSAYTFNGTGFTENLTAWIDGQWKTIAMLKGICIVSGDMAWLTMTDIFYRPSPNDDGAWYAQGDDLFDMISEGYWGAPTIAVVLEMDGDDLISWVDENIDGVRDPGEIIRHLPDADDALSEGHGTFPQLQYAGLGFHNNPSTAAVYVSYDAAFLYGLHTRISSVTVDLKGPARTITGIPLIYYEDRDEWGQGNWPTGINTAVEGGLWWVSRIETVMEDGSRSSYAQENPYGYYTYSFVTDTGYAASGNEWAFSIGQDYATPDADSYLYVETFYNNSSTPNQTDPVIKVYAGGDTENWIAINDDGGGDLMAKVKIPLAAGTYYIAVENAYGDGGAYAIQASTVSFGGSSTGTVSSPDPYEPDNVPSQATVLIDGIPQDHTLSQNDVDWFVFVVE